MSFTLQLVVDEKASTPKDTVYRMLVNGVDRGQANFYEAQLWEETARLRRRVEKVKEKVALLRTRKELEEVWQVGETQGVEAPDGDEHDHSVLSLRRNLLGK